MDFIYKFEFPNRPPEEFVVFLNHKTPSATLSSTDSLPSWTKLAQHQCPHCPLDASTSHCPLAVKISNIIGRFESLISYDETTVTVTTGKRTYICPTTIQRGLGSLLGLVIATSGCPHTTFLKPMAHFHLPVSDIEETICRTVGMYLIGQFFRKDMGRNGALNMSGLIELFENIEKVNLHILKRVRSVSTKDAPLNAIIILDHFAKNTSMAIADELEEIRHHWDAYTSD